MSETEPELKTIDELMKAPSETEVEAALRERSIAILKDAIGKLVKPGMVRTASDHEELLARIASAVSGDVGVSRAAAPRATLAAPRRRRGPGRPRKAAGARAKTAKTAPASAEKKAFSPSEGQQQEAEKLLKGKLDFEKAHAFLKTLHLTQKGPVPKKAEELEKRFEMYKDRIEKIAKGQALAK
jgi:hypothetical protein